MTDELKLETELQPLRMAPEPFCLLARGFTAMGWGGLATAVLYGTRAFCACEVMSLRVPAYIMGSLLTGWGVLSLYEYLTLSGGDLRPARAAGLMLAAQLYMAPFAVWQRTQPLEPFILGNYTALTVVLLMTMLLLNLLSAQLLWRLGARVAARWTTVHVWAILAYGTLILILLAYAAGRGGVLYGPTFCMLTINRTWGIWCVAAATFGTVLVCGYGRSCAMARLLELSGTEDKL
jgi:hypothetical protein